jgi:signal transduction histidine kinase/HAMP domain-containing protein
VTGVTRRTDEADPDAVGRGPSGPGFRARLTLGLIVAAVLPVTVFGLVLLAANIDPDTDDALGRALLLAIAGSVVFAVVLAALLAANLAGALRALTRSVDRVSAGDVSAGLELAGDDEISRLAESQNRLARDLARRNGELRRLLDALQATSPDEAPGTIARRASEDARRVFGMIDCEVLLVDPREIPAEELVPGEPVPVRAVLRVTGAELGVVTGHLPATRRWERADQDLLDLFAIEVAAAIRNAQLYARVETQNRRLVELDQAKDDFLRGVSHNLQTPLASIRGYAQQLAAEQPDRRLEIITEQVDRLSRMVRQLLTVSRIESGALRSRLEVFAPVPRVRRTWEALGAADVPFTLEDRSEGWLALGDRDQLDQVLWALLDNAVGYGGRTPIEALVALDPSTQDLLVTITDHGAGVADEDRERLFGRFERGAGRPSGEGSGLGLYASRALCRAMGGDLELEPAAAGRGAAFTIRLPAEEPGES